MTVTDRAKDIAVLRSMVLGRANCEIFSSGRELRSALPERWQVWFGIFFRVDCRKIPAHPARSPSVCRSLCAVPSSVMDGVWISVVAMGISLLATLVPARQPPSCSL